MNYQVVRNANGKFLGVSIVGGDGALIVPGAAGWDDFLKANANLVCPLDTGDKDPTLAEAIQNIKSIPDSFRTGSGPNLSQAQLQILFWSCKRAFREIRSDLQ